MGTMVQGKVDGKIAIVTGGAMGMGLGTVKVLLKYGAIVTIVDFSDQLEKTVEELCAEGYEVQGFHADVRDGKRLKEIYDEVAAKYGRIDILVNVAGICREFPLLIDDNADEQRDLCMGINFNGVWNSCKAAVPHMLKQKYGKIVNFSSISGPIVCDPGCLAYGSSKGAVMAFTKGLAHELAKSNITVNAILPGSVNTPMLKGIGEESCPDDPQSVLDAMGAIVPMGRLGEIEEAGECVAFLASDESSYVTGHGLVFDGGTTLPEAPGSGWTGTDD